MQLDNESSTSMLPGNVVNLLLIDSRIPANELIVQSMNDNTQCIIFDYSVDTIETLKAKISEHSTPEFRSVGIVQHNYSTPTYQLLHSMQPSVLENAETMDASLESWSELKDFVAFLKDSKKTQHYDLLACNIYSDPNWKYVLTLLDSQCAIHFRASSDTTGWGGNWILESDNVDLTQLYFTEKIVDYPFKFASSNTAHIGILINGKPYTCGWNNYGQLGHGTAGTDVATLTEMVRPTDISSDPTYVAVQIGVGIDYTCVLYSNGTDYKLYSCGCNESGKLGKGIAEPQGSTIKTHTRLSPVSLSALGVSYKTGLVNITISNSLWYYFLVLNYATDFKIYGCGYNYYHGLGTGSNGNYSSLTLIPRSNIPTGTYIKSFIAGGMHTVLIMSNNKIYTVGYNAQGQSGGFNVFTEWSGFNIAGKTIKTIAAGDLHNIVLYTDNTIYGIGYSGPGQCGVIYPGGVGLTQLVPTTPSELTGYTPISISCGPHYNVVMYSNGTTNVIYTNGTNYYGQLGRNPEVIGANDSIYGKPKLDRMVLTGITLSPSIALAYGDRTIVVFKGTDNNVNKIYMCGHNGFGTFGNGLYPTINSSVLKESTTINSLLTTSTLSSAPLIMPNNYDMIFTTAVAAVITPDAPTGLSAAAGNGQITITFTDGSANGSAITNYQYSTDGSSNWTAINPIKATSPVVITGLTNGQSYTYYLRAINGNGNGTTSSSSVTATPRTIPAAPTSLSALAGNGQVTITFTAGAANGSAITNYQYSTDGSSNWSAINPTTATITSPAVITGLTNGQSYTYYLRAINAAGNGAASLTSVTATPYTIPAAPTGLTAAPGNGQVTITFTAGAANGSAITNYQYSTDGSSNWTAINPTTATITSPAVITGLTNGQSYTYYLRAINAAGNGAASSSSVTATPRTTPAAPTITSVTSGNLKATINITPGANNGSAITNYKYSTDGGGTWITLAPASASTTIVVTGLLNETLYSVKVIAVNGAGDSLASSAMSVTPSTTPPDAPTINSITPGNKTASINFTENADNGLAITNYKYSIDNGLSWSLRDPISRAIPLIVSDLENGLEYSIKILAINQKGSSIASNSKSVTPGYAPDAPTITSISSGDGTASVHFFDNNTNGFNITNYRYSIDSDAWVMVAATNPIALSGLNNGQTYSIRILAVNDRGDSPPSGEESVTPATIPEPPVIDDIVSGNNTLSINFNPGQDNGAVITNYKYSTNGGIDWTIRTPASAESPIVLTSKIVNGTPYSIVLKARNEKGFSSESNVQEIMAAEKPSAPTIYKIKPGDTKASIYFVAGAANGSAISNYLYSIDDGSSWITPSPASTSRPLVISDLLNNQTYPIRLMAVNGKGNSLQSNAVNVTTATSPDAPTIVDVSGSDSFITIRFTEGANNGSPITNYKYSTNGGEKWTLRTPVSKESPMVVSRLTAGVPYSVKIKAKNAQGISSVESNEISITF